MKKKYNTPEIDLIKFSLKDAILATSTDAEIFGESNEKNDIIGSGDSGFGW